VPTAPPENDRFFTAAVPIVAASTVYDTPLNDLSWRAERMLACMVSIVRVIEVMALSAASIVLMPFAGIFAMPPVSMAGFPHQRSRSDCLGMV
jgi:hypothetical protein